MDGDDLEESCNIECSDNLIPSPEQDSQGNVMLRFCYFLATEDCYDGRASSTLMGYFSAVCGLSHPDGADFLRPAY